MRKPWYCWALHRYTLLPAIHFPGSYNLLLISNGPIKFGFIYLARNRLNACLFRIHNLLAFVSSDQGFKTMNIYLIQRATVRQERCGILATNDRILRPNSSWQSSTDVKKFFFFRLTNTSCAAHYGALCFTALVWPPVRTKGRTQWN